MHISRRYVKKFGIPDPADEVTGYESMDEVCHDLDEVVDVLWFSGTPSLQVPYLLSVALAFNTYLPSFPPSPRPTFNFLRKLDHCFASLLVGYDVKTKDLLPGFSSAVDNSIKPRFSRTDMVRCKSLADETRMLVAMVVSGEVDVIDDADDDGSVVRRPARARTETRSESVDAANLTPHSFHGADPVKAEESDDDADDDDLGLTNKETTTAFKRRAEETADNVSMTCQTSEPKRLKTEDDGDASMDLDDIPSADADVDPPVSASNASIDNNKGQFHWALDDDDSDDEDQPSVVVPAKAEVPRSPPQPPDLNVDRCNDRRLEGRDVNEGAEELGEDDDEDESEEEEEDEELQMNVGRVYEKTLVQLGLSLGQTLLDD
ncbi:hypothetical protein GGR50DRAFT_691300 [Xylaria sp. CBS 124048]|nr:hypothetical protein GGR50DRAFT_691300 [Xylaria sp. CBS 124048]